MAEQIDREELGKLYARINALIDKGIAGMSEEEREEAEEARDAFFHDLMKEYIETGSLPYSLAIVPNMKQETVDELDARATKALRRIVLGRDCITLHRVEALEQAASLFPEDDPKSVWAVWAIYDFEGAAPVGLGCNVIDNTESDAKVEIECRACMAEDMLYESFGGEAEDPDGVSLDPESGPFGPFTMKCSWTRSPWPRDIGRAAYEVAVKS